MIYPFSSNFLKFKVATAAAGMLVSGMGYSDDAPANQPAKSPPSPVHPVKRYESLWTNSPFGKGPSSARTASVEWSLAGVFEIEGKKGAVLVNEKTGAVENVSVDAPNDSGIQLVTVQAGGKGAAPRVEISQNGETQWVTSRKLQSVPMAVPNRALVNSRAGEPVPRPEPKERQPNAERRSRPQAQVTPQNPAPPSPLDLPVGANDSTGASRGRK